MKTTKFTIEIDYSLSELKEAYKDHSGDMPKNKRDIAIWFETMVESILQDHM